MADSLREKISKPTIFYKRGNPRRAIQVINNYLFGEKGFTGVDDESAFLLNKVIEKKKGSCLGLSILYLSLAQRLNLSIYLVTAPKHYFVRYDNGKYRQNIETRMRGLDLPDFHYQISFNVPEGTIPKGVYLRNLSKKETIICMLGSAGAALGAKHKDKEGSNLLDLALKFAPDNPEIYFNKAIICCKNKQYSEAITLFNTVILLDPWFTEAYRNRGVAYESKGEIHKAIKDYNQAIKLDSNDASSYALRGHAYRKIGELEKAKKDFDKFVKLKKAMRENEQQ